MALLRSLLGGRFGLLGAREFGARRPFGRCAQALKAIAPRDIRAAIDQPSLSEQEIGQLRQLLVASAPLLPALVSAEDYFLRGNGHYLAGQYDEALADYNRSLELRPDHPATLCNRACLFAVQGKSNEAIVDLRRAIAGDPKRGEIARTDSDFDGIRGDPRFRALVGEGEESSHAGSA